MRNLHNKWALSGLLVGLFLGLGVPAQSHAQFTFYPNKWAADTTYGFGYLAAPLNTSTARTSISSGAGAWNAVSGSWFDITSNGTVNPMVIWISNYCSMTAGNWMVSRDLSGLGAIGNASHCFSGSTLTKVIVQFDDPASWYTGSGGPLANQYGLRSVAAHEFGHATGFLPGFNNGHYQSTDAACTVADPNKNTMCAGISPGTVWHRTLGSHDIHTVEDAY
jgi:hypothetical protein